MSEECCEGGKNAAYELGHISQLHRMADTLRTRSGESFALDRYDEADILKSLSKELADEATARRAKWDEKYHD